MVPRLKLINDNSIREIEGKIYAIGSSNDCHLRLSGIPGRCAHLLFTKGIYTLHTLSQDVAVTVNGKPVSTGGCGLHHGDHVQVGIHTLQFLEHVEEAKTIGSGNEYGGNSVILKDLIGSAVLLLRSRDDSLFSSLVGSISKLLRCDGARLVVDDDTIEERKTIARYPKGAGLDRFSNRAIDWAHEAAHTILMHEDTWKSEKEMQTSLEKNLVSSIMCAPLRRGDVIAGYLYLDRIDNEHPFTEEDRLFCDALIPLFSEILSNFHERQQQQATIERLQKRNLSPSGGILFESEQMAQRMALAARLAKTDSPVLITGETGTGKELFARYVHDNSMRATGPYRAINCGAIPENLIESELFGHEKGAFTGALTQKIGLFESAEGGTVFLDEIGDMPLHLQVKLLRTVQEAEVVRVGGSTTIPINVRIIAATNRNLEKEVTEGRFRQDLFFRLNVLTLNLPPLRDRGDDVILLAEYFINRYCQQFGFDQKTLSAGARNLLISYSWPGNIRELENTIQKAILFCETNRLVPENFSLTKGGSVHRMVPEIEGMTLKDARNEAERHIIATTLQKTHGNVSLAGKILAIDRKWLIKKMDELAIDANTFRH